MIDIQPYLDKLDRLKEYMDCYIELNSWLQMPLKPFPYKSQRKFIELSEYLQLNN